MQALPHSMSLTLHQATADPCFHQSPEHSQTSLGQSLVG